jgi:hypothetical protein
MSVKQLGAAALAAIALITAGCGSSSKGGETTNASTSTAAGQTTAANQGSSTPAAEIKVSAGTPLSRTAWIARADGICAHANTLLSTTTAKTTQDFARLLPQAAGYERTEAVELAKLVPPHGLAGDWQQIVTSLQKFSELSLKAAGYAQANNWQQATPVARAGNKAQEEMVAIAKHDGFKVCSMP